MRADQPEPLDVDGFRADIARESGKSACLTDGDFVEGHSKYLND